MGAIRREKPPSLKYDKLTTVGFIYQLEHPVKEYPTRRTTLNGRSSHTASSPCRALSPPAGATSR